MADGTSRARPRFHGSKESFLADLAALGSPVSTVVHVNGRPMLLDAALRLIEQLPDESEFDRAGHRVFITPNPFRPQADEPRDSHSLQLVRRLMARQDETDQLAEEERSAWQKLKYRLTGRW